MLDDMKTDMMKQSRGQLDRMKDIRETMWDNQPWKTNSVELGCAKVAVAAIKPAPNMELFNLLSDIKPPLSE